MKKLIIKTSTFEGIPYNEYALEGIEYKGLVFVQHGFQSTKEYGADYLALTLARKGHKVVSIDAFKHGERIEEPYISENDAKRYGEIFHVVDQTADDILYLYEEKYASEFPMFDMIGVSMGGFIAYSVALRTNKVNKLVPTITTPMLLKLAKTRHNVPNIKEYQEVIKPHLPYVETLDIYSQKEMLTYQELLIVSGEKDPIIPIEDSIKFFHEIDCHNAKLHIHDEVHEVNRKMQQEIFDFISNEKAAL